MRLNSEFIKHVNSSWKGMYTYIQSHRNKTGFDYVVDAGDVIQGAIKEFNWQGSIEAYNKLCNIILTERPKMKATWGKGTDFPAQIALILEDWADNFSQLNGYQLYPSEAKGEPGKIFISASKNSLEFTVVVSAEQTIRGTISEPELLELGLMGKGLLGVIKKSKAILNEFKPYLSIILAGAVKKGLNLNFTDLATELKEIKQRLVDSESELQTAQSIIVSLTGINKSLEQANASVNSLLSAAGAQQAAVAQLSEQIVTLTKQNREMERDSSEARTESIKVRAALVEKERLLVTAQSRVAELEQRLGRGQTLAFSAEKKTGGARGRSYSASELLGKSSGNFFDDGGSVASGGSRASQMSQATTLIIGPVPEAKQQEKLKFLKHCLTLKRLKMCELLYIRIKESKENSDPAKHALAALLYHSYHELQSGSPKSLEVVLGLIKEEKKETKEIIDTLSAKVESHLDDTTIEPASNPEFNPKGHFKNILVSGYLLLGQIGASMGEKIRSEEKYQASAKLPTAAPGKRTHNTLPAVPVWGKAAPSPSSAPAASPSSALAPLTPSPVAAASASAPTAAPALERKLTM